MPLTTAHPERILLHEFAIERLTGDERAMVEQHLRRCTACRALVNSIPPPVTPSVDAAVAAADEEPAVELAAPVAPPVAAAPVVLEPIDQTSQLPVVPQRMTPVRAAGRTRRIVAAALAVFIIILLAASAWYVTTDDFHDRSAATSNNASSTSGSSGNTQRF